ncbi:MAG: putative selenate reductase subunit YgfK, partial [Oscillospiraceae bacterium]
AQNIVAAYYAGARFFELKTVQVIDGDALAAMVSRPCILAHHEGYNCEWSTELTVQQAFEEYVKAWCVLKVMCRRWSIGYPDGFVFNMSVGYDLEGIKSEKIDNFIEGLKNAADTKIFRDCLEALSDMFPDDAAYISNISPNICRSATLSTLHGCPPDEIERIASYLMAEKGLHTFVKCNPTILGYADARKILDDMGYDGIAFDDHHFKEDLQYADAVPMFRRLMALAEEKGLEFGLKLSNTFPVDVKQNELPSAEMYMSGRSLFPLTVDMARRISHDFGGKLRISYSGGADYFNIDRLYNAGIFPITMATTLLKLGGYQRLKPIAEKLEALPYHAFNGIDAEALDKIEETVFTDKHHRNPIKPLPTRKIQAQVPLMDCFDDPCRDGCPIKQDIPEYIELHRIGHYADALRVILARNPLPFITGILCTHRCMDKCTRNFYDSPVQIREVKLKCAEGGYDEVIRDMRPLADRPEIRVAVVGGGTTGMAAAHFLARYGAHVTIFDRNETLGGIVRHVIPGFRISDEAIEKDVSFLRALGVEIRLGADAPSIEALREMGYTQVFLATGAWKPGRLDITGNIKPVIPWMKALKAGQDTNLGKNVVVIGGGNTAMDAARTAKHVPGVTHVSLLYRRTKKYMPADEHELYEAIEDGVGFIELASPVKQENGVLTCRRMVLGEPDEKGRRSPIETDELFDVPCDTVISAVGEQVDGEFFKSQGIAVDRRSRPAFDCGDGVFCGGDCMRGPATIIAGAADAKRFAETVLGIEIKAEIPPEANRSYDEAVAKKGTLVEGGCEGERCLSCQVVCQRCVDVCPNRANVTIRLPDGRAQILHIDRMCNECGNCGTFCVYESLPYKEKFTLFHTVEEFAKSTNFGFVLLGRGKVRVRMIGVKDHNLYGANTLPPDLRLFIKTVVEDYGYLI